MPMTLNERQALVSKLTTNCASLKPLESMLLLLPEDKLREVEATGCSEHTNNEQLFDAPPQGLAAGDKLEVVTVNGQTKYKVIKAVTQQQTPSTQTNNSQSVTLDALPPELRRMVANAAQIEAAERQRLVEQIKASGRCPYTDEQLAQIPIENEGQVTGLRTLAMAFNPDPVLAPVYTAAAGGTVFANNADSFRRDEDILDIPVINFKEAAKSA